MKGNWCYKRIDWLSRPVCVEVVWTQAENGGRLVGEENNRIRCRCDVERMAKNGTDGRCEEC